MVSRKFFICLSVALLQSLVCSEAIELSVGTSGGGQNSAFAKTESAVNEQETNSEKNIDSIAGASGNQDPSSYGFPKDAFNTGKGIFQADLQMKSDAFKPLGNAAGSIGSGAINFNKQPGQSFGGFAGRQLGIGEIPFDGINDWVQKNNPFAPIFSGAKTGFQGGLDAGNYLSKQFSNNFHQQTQAGAVQGDNFLKNFGFQKPIFGQLEDNTWNNLETGRNAAFNAAPQFIPDAQTFNKFTGGYGGASATGLGLATELGSNNAGSSGVSTGTKTGGFSIGI